MQEVVDVINTAAENTGSFGRVEYQLIDSAKDSHYPLHYAWERDGTFTKAYRERYHFDADKTARFAIVAPSADFTPSEVEDLYKDIMKRALDQRKGISPVDIQVFDADFGAKSVRIGLYEVQIDSDLNVNT